jgi:hypothetical protein
MASDLESIQSFNFSAIVPTSICFMLGLAYYYYKFRNVSENIRENPLLGNRREESRQERQESSIYNQSNQFNENSNQNEFSSNSLDFIKIFVIISSERKMFQINKNLLIGDFIKNEVKRNINNFSNNQTIILICQGRRLDESKKFCEYPSISSDTVLHCFITHSSTNQSNTNNNGNNEQHSPIEDERAVSIYTIILHSSILILIAFLIITFKSIDDLFSKGTLLLLQFLIFIWITQVSKCVAKLILHKKIVYY